VKQATDFGDGRDPAEPRRLDRPSLRGILVERGVSSCAVVVGEVGGQDAPQMLLLGRPGRSGMLGDVEVEDAPNYGVSELLPEEVFWG
jgi:hypothetical protein